MGKRYRKKRRRGRAAGFIVIGSGFAIILSGKLITFINSIYASDGWRISWLILGFAVILIAFLCALLLRDRPEKIGLHPMGYEKGIVNEKQLFKWRNRHFYFYDAGCDASGQLNISV